MIKPNVLICMNKGHPTETELTIRLRDSGLQITAVIDPKSPNLAALNRAEIPVIKMAFKNNFDWKKILWLRQRIKQDQFNIVHALSNKTIANSIWASYGLPHKLIAYRGAIGHISRIDPSCYLKSLNPRLDTIVCVSNAVMRDLANHGVPRQKLTTIYKGHDPNWYDSIDQSIAREDLCKEFDIPCDSLIIGMAGTLRPVKGADILIRAMEELPPDVYVVLVGPLKDARLSKAITNSPQKNRVKITGYRDDAIDLIAGFDVNLALSRGREGLTKTIVEGMFQGKASITTDAGGLPEMVSNGETGYVIPIDDVGCLAEQIMAMRTSPELRYAMGSAARRLADSRFHVDQTTQLTSELYTKILQD